MDPLTHALAGATLAWATAGSRIGRRALLVGAAAALLPDADVFIRSGADPLLAIEHHRGFTHSLFFVPIGGLLTSLPFRARTDRTQWRWLTIAAAVAWLSHALLDAATTYGTQLFWPISRHRVGLDIISIIDPLFTAIVLLGAIAAYAGRRHLITIALILAALWLGLGCVQRARATNVQTRLAHHRGHRITRAAVFPTVGNTIVWRSLYQTGNTLHIDRLRVPWQGTATHAPTTSVALVAPTLPNAPARIRRDLARFAWFSDQWLARDPADPTIIGDARYSLHPDRYEPVWGIRLHASANAPTQWVNRSRQRKAGMATLWREIRGEDPAYRPVE